jgi:heptosyltransferase I
MGDVIHNLPIINDICAHLPQAEIDWVVEESFADIVALHPKVSHIIPIAFRRWRHNLFTKKTYSEITNALNDLRKNKYDYILDTQGLLKSALICLCARGTRVGRDWQSNREGIASIFYQRRYRVEFMQHAVNRGRELTALALSYNLPNSPPDYGLQSEKLAANIGTNLLLPKNYVVFLHATSRDSKLWPNEHWVKLGKALIQQGLTLVFPWSNNAELTRAETIAQRLSSATILPKLPLKQLAEVIAGAKAAVGVDTGLVHLAVALKIPAIGIYTDSDPKLNGAYAGKDAIAINIGGERQIPSADEVLSAFSTLNVTL